MKKHVLLSLASGVLLLSLLAAGGMWYLKHRSAPGPSPFGINRTTRAWTPTEGMQLSVFMNGFSNACWAKDAVALERLHYWAQVPEPLKEQARQSWATIFSAEKPVSLEARDLAPEEAEAMAKGMPYEGGTLAFPAPPLAWLSVNGIQFDGGKGVVTMKMPIGLVDGKFYVLSPALTGDAPQAGAAAKKSYSVMFGGMTGADSATGAWETQWTATLETIVDGQKKLENYSGTGTNAFNIYADELIRAELANGNHKGKICMKIFEGDKDLFNSDWQEGASPLVYQSQP